ncbi:MAG: hypothetical protein Q4F83_02610 [Eubacteriales bacterium]|nr:hypothetical protein [Eubacteriales bacterium]
MKKRNLILTACMMGCLILGSYGSIEAAEKETTEVSQEAADGSEVIADETIAGWHIVVEEFRVDKSLENISVDLGYTGVETSDFKKEAEEGKVFCLVKLVMEKEGSKEVIDWEKMKLTDKEENEYARIEDAFLTDLGMMRMPGTSLNFGSNEGWIVFEINEGAEELTLSYPFEAEEFSKELTDEE